MKPAKATNRTFISKQRIMPLAYLRLSQPVVDPEEGRFIESMKTVVGHQQHVVPIGRARAGIYLLTRFAVQSGRKRVLLSPYTIPDVATMVTLAGGEPVFFDFESRSTACDLEGLESLMDSDTACVMVTHYHVNEPRIEAIRAACSRHGTYLFDDCALAFGGELHGKPVGALTDASVFSFSSFKTLNYFWGGAITTAVPEIVEFIRKEVSRWPRLKFRDYLKQAVNCLKYDVASRPPVFNTLTFPHMRRRALRTADSRGLQNVRTESDALIPSLTSRPSSTAFAEWNSKIGRVPAVIQNRRAIAAIYRATLGERMVSAGIADDVIAGSCFVNFPVWVGAEARQGVYREMAAAGFDIGHNLYPNVHRYPRFEGSSGSSCNVQALTEACVYLPTHLGVSPAYADRIARRLAQLL
jgi:perosamine synthetase